MQKFNYKTIQELDNAIKAEKLDIALNSDLSPLLREVEVGDIKLYNSMAILPMEGCDSDKDGAPGELTIRRCKRFAAGGAGIIWFEAMAVTNAGRGNPRQLSINEKTVDTFTKLIKEMREVAKSNGLPKPFIIAQLTHAGRYSNPEGIPSPVVAQPNALLDAKYKDNPPRIITDNEIVELEDQFVEAAKLAKQAGFDAVDVKSCHRYLLSDFLSAFDRPGPYGGSFENRTRLFFNIIDKINALDEPIRITPRINAYDGLVYPYGFGSDKDNNPDLTEPLKLLGGMAERGIKLTNISCGNPYYNPHVGRPFDNGPYIPPQSQLFLLNRMLKIIDEMQKSQPEMAIVCTGLSWFRQFGANVAAAGIENGSWKIAGFGRQSLAYPDFARDIAESGTMYENKCCTSCSNCTQIMRDGGTTGCVVRDSEIYLPIIMKGRAGRKIPSPLVKSDHIL